MTTTITAVINGLLTERAAAPIIRPRPAPPQYGGAIDGLELVLSVTGPLSSHFPMSPSLSTSLPVSKSLIERPLVGPRAARVNSATAGCLLPLVCTAGTWSPCARATPSRFLQLLPAACCLLRALLQVFACLGHRCWLPGQPISGGDYVAAARVASLTPILANILNDWPCFARCPGRLPFHLAVSFGAGSPFGDAIAGQIQCCVATGALHGEKGRHGRNGWIAPL